MFGHLMKLIWKRKTRNVMLSLEILLAFALVFAISAFGLRNYQLYQMPIGFAHDDVWSVHIQAGDAPKGSFDAALYDKFKRGLESLPGVRQVAFAGSTPFANSTMRTDVANPAGGKRVRTDMFEVSDDFFAVAGVRLAEGRAFDRSDDGAAAEPVVVNRRMAKALFGDGPALGKQFDAAEPDAKKPELMRVVGIVDEFRNKGELMAPVNFIIVRHTPGPLDSGLRTILLKLDPGTPRSFEAGLSARLKLIRNDWSYSITPLAAQRSAQLKSNLTPLVILAVIAAFLLVMVAFGLFGVLWQNTTRRIPEIGLRRAIGANAGHIYRQIIAEQFLLSTAAMLVGLLLLVQLPLTGTFGEALNWRVFGAATALSMAVIYLLSLACSVYPGWRASRLSPTDALHYE
jgi:putative ABC transport system permease protein